MKNQTKTKYIIMSITLLILGFVAVFWSNIKAFLFKGKISPITTPTLPTVETNKFLAGSLVRGADIHGSGHYGAPRGSRTHKGLDVEVTPNTDVHAPFDCVITKHGIVYTDTSEYRYIEFKGVGSLFNDYRVRYMYVTPTAEVYGTFKKGTKIGVYQDIGKRYAGITPHTHIEVYSIKTGAVLDPTQFL